MADCDINILAQQGNRALVRVTCTACSDENLLQIVFQGEGDAAVAAPPAQSRRRRKPLIEIDEGRPENVEPISSDELLDLHTFLEAHGGGFRELVSSAEA